MRPVTAFFFFLTTMGAHGAPSLTLKASLRGYLAAEVPPKGHRCQSPQCVCTKRFKEVPSQLHLVIPRASMVSQPRLALAVCHTHTQPACIGQLQWGLPINSWPRAGCCSRLVHSLQPASHSSTGACLAVSMPA